MAAPKAPSRPKRDMLNKSKVIRRPTGGEHATAMSFRKGVNKVMPWSAGRKPPRRKSASYQLGLDLGKRASVDPDSPQDVDFTEAKLKRKRKPVRRGGPLAI